MEQLLEDLGRSASACLKELRGQYNTKLIDALHNHSQDCLPDVRTTAAANSLLDTMHELQILLQPAQITLADHYLGPASTKCLVAAVDLGVPDALHLDKASSIPELAKACNANPDRLRQIMRMLASEGIFTHDTSLDVFSHNHVSELLMSSHWMGWRHWVNLYANEFYDMGRRIPEACVATEKRTPAQLHYETELDLIDYVIEQGWLPKIYRAFNAAAVAQAAGLLADYPWHEIDHEKIIDIGGGDGGFLASLLRAFTNMRGGILEKPGVIDMVKTNFRGDGMFADIGDRVADADLVGGDFFESVPKNDIYVIKYCIHNWMDEDATQILRTIRRCILRTGKSRLILFECVLEEGHSSRLARYADMNMFIAVKGQERSMDQWNDIAARSGWNISRTLRLRNAWPMALELTPKWDPAINDTPESTESSCLVDGDVKANMTFLEPWHKTQGNPYFRSMADPGFDKTNFTWTDHDVSVVDARPNNDAFTLDRNGFVYVQDPAGGLDEELRASISNNDRSLIETTLYPRVTQLVKAQTGANRVIVFDHTVRRRRPELDPRSNENGQEQPATIVHCDQSAKGAIRRLKQHLEPDEDVDEILKKRIQLINVWRPLNGTVVDWPLAQMDFSTLDAGDAHPCDLWRHQFEDRGQTMTYTFNPGQKWYYLGRHQMDEVTMLKIWDNASHGVANSELTKQLQD